MELKVPPQDSPDWDAFVSDYPLHKAVVGKASAHVVEARVNQMLGWIGSGCGRGKVLQLGTLQWGLSDRQVDKIRALCDERLRQEYALDRTDYLAEKLRQIDEAIEIAIRDRQLSALVGLLALAGKWTKLEG